MLSQPAIRCDPRIHHQLDPFLVFGGSVRGAEKIDDVTGEQYVERADANVVVMILKTSSFYVEQGGQVRIWENLVKDVQETGGILTIEDLRNYKVNVMDVLAVTTMSKALIRPKRTREALSRRDGAKQWFLKKDPTKFFANGVNLNAYGRGVLAFPEASSLSSAESALVGGYVVVFKGVDVNVREQDSIPKYHPKDPRGVVMDFLHSFRM
ncbi:hypothetical protein Tco_1382011 [Tanacetum coccineum]